MITLKLEIYANKFQDALVKSVNTIGSQNTFRLIGDIVIEQLLPQFKNDIQSVNILRYKIEWFRPNVLLDRENPSLVELSKIPEINLGDYQLEIVTNSEKSFSFQVEPSENLSWIDPVKLDLQKLKTVSKHRIRLFSVCIKSEILLPVVNSFSPCQCHHNYLVPHINGVWDFALQFICKVCGKTYICECFRQALEIKYSEIQSNKNRYGLGSLDKRIVTAFEQSEFRDGICHICRDITSELFYCHPQYGSKVLVHYGPYIAKTAIEKNIDLREAENEIRELLGIPRIGEGWISEVELLNLVKQIFPDQEVIHQASPDWLGRQRLDIFIPGKNLAIEYQGRQHYDPVEFFGGQDGLEQTKKRDKLKAELCTANGVDLIYFRYDETISKQLVEDRIRNIK